jgi:hypothetical protein
VPRRPGGSRGQRSRTVRHVMKVIVQDRFGAPEVLELREVDKPQVGDGEVLVQVRAASVNPADWYAMAGTPWVARPQLGLRKPKTGRLGLDLAGVVAAVGGAVRGLTPGEEVFGAGTGTLAEYVAVPEAALVRKPASLSFEQAAAVPVAALTALQGLRDKGQLRPGHQVLVNGASGGVGTFAVQLAKALGAQVTGVCSTGNVEMAGSLGADQVIDYTRQDFTRSGRRYDLLGVARGRQGDAGGGTHLPAAPGRGRAALPGRGTRQGEACHPHVSGQPAEVGHDRPANDPRAGAPRSQRPAPTGHSEDARPRRPAARTGRRVPPQRPTRHAGRSSPGG